MEAPDRLSPAPPLHGCRPLLGLIILRERLERTHQLAVDKPGEERVEFAGDHGHGRFVEKPQALGDVAGQDDAPCLGDPAHGGSGRIALRTDIDGAPGPLPSALEVARQQPFVVAHHRQPGVDRGLALRLQQAFRPGDPPANRGHHRCIEEQVHRDTDRRACCRKMISRAHVLRVGPFPSVDRHIEVARGVGGLGEKGKVRSTERAVRVCLDQKAVSLLPIAPPHGFPRLVHKLCRRSSAHPRPRGGIAEPPPL